MSLLSGILPGEWEAQGQTNDWQGRMGGLLSGDNALFNLGIGILANNNSNNLGQVLGRGALQGAQQTQQAKAFGLQNKRLEAQDKRLEREDKEYESQQEAIARFKQNNPTLADAVDLDPKLAIKAAYPSLSANSADPYYTLQPTPQGIMKFNVRTGEFELLKGQDGKPIMKSSDDATLQGLIEEAKSRADGNYKIDTSIPGTVQTVTQTAEQANPALMPKPIPSNVPRVNQPSMVVPPALQKQRDDVRLQILLEEQRNDGGPGKNPELDKEIARFGPRAGGGIAIPTPEQQAALTEQAKMQVENRTKAQSTLPAVTAEAENSIRLIDDLLSADGFKQAVGGSRMFQIQRIPGTDAYDFDTRLEQLKGKQFLQAYEGLKGAGAITDIEGTKAGNAIARMDAAQSEEEFTKAAREFQTIIRGGLERAKGKAGINTSTQQNNAPKRRAYNPKTGRIE